MGGGGVLQRLFHGSCKKKYFFKNLCSECCLFHFQCKQDVLWNKITSIYFQIIYEC